MSAVSRKNVDGSRPPPRWPTICVVSLAFGCEMCGASPNWRNYPFTPLGGITLAKTSGVLIVWWLHTLDGLLGIFRCGHHPLRKGTEVLLGDGGRNLIDPFHHAASLSILALCTNVERRYAEKTQRNLAITFDMRLSRHSWEEIAGALGCESAERGLNLLSVRLSRAIRRAASQ
jgi:hypothetical protein